METIFNNINLDSYIPGFTTVNVHGRELYQPELIIVNDVVVDVKYPPRTITVDFVLQGKNKSEFRQYQDQLNRYLTTGGDVNFTFTDEDWIYKGQVQSVVSPPVNYFVGQGNFTIRCDSPLKIGDKMTGSNYQPMSLINQINLTATGSRQNINVTNTSIDYGITILEPVVSGDEIVINFDTNRITKNGSDITDKIDFTQSRWNQMKLNLTNSAQAILAIGFSVSINYTKVGL